MIRPEAIGDAIYGMKSKNKNELLTVNKNKRKCAICNKLLSMYTPGKYCNAHMYKGQLIEDAKIDAVIEIDRKKHNKKMRIKAKNKRKEKHGLQSSK